MAFTFDFGEEGPSVASAVYQALGFASLCWSETPTGVFDAGSAREAGDTLIKFMDDLWREGPWLGLASTEQLLNELKARCDVGGSRESELWDAVANVLEDGDRTFLDYRTFDDG